MELSAQVYFDLSCGTNRRPFAGCGWAGEAMTIEQLMGLLAVGVKKGASDIHLEAGYPPSYRIRGELFSAKLDRLTPNETMMLAQQILNKDDPFLAASRHDVDRSFGIPGVARFRASVFRQRGSVGLVLRVIPFEVPTLAQLNLPAVLGSIAGARSGLILVTGATGNGKSTTIASMLDQINKTDRVHIVMIEDPIEYTLTSERAVVIQREVGTDTDSFATALRAALRQDPDVIMVGELRDYETADTCLKAAETGHLVISSLHTPDVQRTIGRFVGVFGAQEQDSVRVRLADNLRAIVSLRLVPKDDGSMLLPAVEILIVTRTVQEAIRDPAKVEALTSIMEKSGDDVEMQTFDQHLLELYRAGKINPETAKKAATRRADLERAMMLENS
jgi:twitching motility protein PilT